MLSTSFPAVDSSPETETPSDNVFVTVQTERDPFRADSIGRRSSEASGKVDNAPTGSRVDQPRPEMIRAAAGTRASAKKPSNGEPPLCSLVVDDDK